MKVNVEDGTALADAVASVPGDESLEPEQLRLREDQLQSVREALDALPANYGDALEWKYIEGCSVNEIGARLGLNPIATQSLLARARRSFRLALQNTAAGAPDELQRAREVER